MLVRKNIIKGGLLALNNKLGKMINDDVLNPCLVLDFQVKLLQG